MSESKTCAYYDAEENTCGYHDRISHGLEAENARLRKEVADWQDQYVRVVERNRELRESVAAAKKAAKERQASEFRKYYEVCDEGDELRELVKKIWVCARLMDANRQIEGMRITDSFREECEAAFAKLGIEVD